MDRFDHNKTGISVAQSVIAKEKQEYMKNVKILLSLIEYLKEYLPFDNTKKFSDMDIEVYAFIRLYQKLGGKTIEIDGFITITESFEVSLRLLNDEKVVLKKRKRKPEYVIGASPYVLYTRKHIASSLVAAVMDDKVVKNSRFDLNFDKTGFTRNPKTKMKIGSKIPKQKQIRRR